MKALFKKVITFVLTLEARLVLWKYEPRIVGVTGSVGKSSTKDAIYTALSSSFYVRKSQKSFNTELGIPLTILGCDSAWSNPLLWLRNIFTGLTVLFLPNHYPQWLVLEVGLDRPGDIRRVVRWISFDVVVYTQLSDAPVHVEFFESAEALLEEKSALMDALKSGGTLVSNADDPLQEGFFREGCGSLTYGFGERALLRGSHVETAYEGGAPAGVSLRVDYAGSSVPMELSGVLGLQHAYPVLAGCAVGVSEGVNLVSVGKAFERHAFLPGRMRILAGREGVSVLDDSYNASPIAVRAALDVLEGLSVEGRKVVVLGDMTELGELTVSAHEAAGERVAAVADLFITVGQRTLRAAEAARLSGMDAGRVVSFTDAREAGDFVRDRLERGDVVLVKGSQSMRMEKAVEKLLARPEEARDVLARQDREWVKR